MTINVSAKTKMKKKKMKNIDFNMKNRFLRKCSGNSGPPDSNNNNHGSPISLSVNVHKNPLRVKLEYIEITI